MMSSFNLKENETTAEDLTLLARCVDLAEEAFQAGDAPFGSIPVREDGSILATARNRIKEHSILAHPEYELAEWALYNLPSSKIRTSTMYTSGEYCAMCAGANAWARIGHITYLSSGSQLEEWAKEAG